MVEGCQPEDTIDYIDKTVRASVIQFQASSPYTESKKEEVEL
jgi:hypothetical protein